MTKVTIILGLLFVLVEVPVRVLVKHKHHFVWEEIVGFYALFGFFGCIAISVFSKFLSSKILMRDEDYYEKRYRR